MGLTSGAIAGWGAIPTALMITGIAVIAVWLFLESSSHPGFWGRRSTQVGTNALLATLAMLAIVGMVNVLAVRYPARIDLTENRIFTLGTPVSRGSAKLKAARQSLGIFGKC